MNPWVSPVDYACLSFGGGFNRCIWPQVYLFPQFVPGIEQPRDIEMGVNGIVDKFLWRPKTI